MFVHIFKAVGNGVRMYQTADGRWFTDRSRAHPFNVMEAVGKVRVLRELSTGTEFGTEPAD